MFVLSGSRSVPFEICRTTEHMAKMATSSGILEPYNVLVPQKVVPLFPVFLSTLRMFLGRYHSCLPLGGLLLVPPHLMGGEGHNTRNLGILLASGPLS